MTWSLERQAIVDALNTISGVSAVGSMPDVPHAGAAWPVWTGTDMSRGKLARPISRHYTAVLLLPAGYHAETVDQADGLDEQLIYALSKVGNVDGMTVPTSVLFDNQRTMPGIQCPVTLTIV